MRDIKPKAIHVESFTVAGISVRTKNSDEFNQETAKLPTLWQRYYADAIADKLTNKTTDACTYGVYSDFESDANGHYRVTVGIVADNDEPLPELHTVNIHAGDYLVFENKGEMPQAVIEIWQSIWSFFSNESAYQRRFDTDFEAYVGADEICVYIGIH